MIMKGWVSLHRKLLTSDVFQNEKLLKVFIYCLLKATHSEHSQKVGKQTVVLKPGQFVFGRRRAAFELDMKESTVRDYMKILKDDGTIAINPTNKYSVVTLTNWELYQDKEERNDNKSDNKKPTKGQQNNTNNNGNNADNEDNDLNTYIHDLFEHYVSMNIVRHKKITSAMKSAIKARLKDYSFEELKKAIDNYATVLNSDMHYYTYKHPLADLMRDKDIRKFADEADPLNNFKKRDFHQTKPHGKQKIEYDPNKHVF
jgi:hypothetical protein